MEPPALGFPTLENRRRTSGATSEAVPTVERALAPMSRWSTTTQGVRFRIVSTTGCSYRGRRFRRNSR